MHATDRDRIIIDAIAERGFASFRELDRLLDASPATIRRDLDRLQRLGRLVRVRGGARGPEAGGNDRLLGTPFHENVDRMAAEKARIGRAAAELCAPGSSIIIDGGTTTYRMCRHLGHLGLQVLTNSLHIVSALLPQPNTRVSVPAGNIFREQDIILSAFDDDGTSSIRAVSMFMGAAGIGPYGLMQIDPLLMQAERRLLARADSLIVLVDSSKFNQTAGHRLVPLERISVLVTDSGLAPAHRAMVDAAGVRLVLA